MIRNCLANPCRNQTATDRDLIHICSDCRCAYNVQYRIMSNLSHRLTSFGRLAIVLDVNVERWATLFEETATEPESSLSLSFTLDSIIAFAHQYNTLNRDNRISFWTMDDERCVLFISFHIFSNSTLLSLSNSYFGSKLVYPTTNKENNSNPITAMFEFGLFREATQKVILDSSKATIQLEPPIAPLHAALSRCFLYLSRQEQELCASASEIDSELEIPLSLGASQFPARILVLTLSKDSNIHTLPTINAMFACHKRNIIIDSLVLSSSVISPRLQVAAELTGGYHCNVTQKSELQKLLLSTFIVDAPMRDVGLKLPKLVHVSHKATCFCHSRSISIGYVCSVCLAVFCEPCAPCRVCSVEFSQESIPSPLALAINQST